MSNTTKKPRKRLEIYKAKDGWRFRAIAGNGKIVGGSEEGIKQRTYAVRRAARQFPDFADLAIVVIDADGEQTVWE